MKQSFTFIPSFDGLRGLAVTLVVLSHTSYGQVNGWIGVDLFFILSGYLITSLLQKEYFAFNHVSFYNFYARRILRLAPALLLGVGLANVVWILRPSLPGNRTLATVATLFYVNNFLNVDITGLLGPLWSLSVEEHFYFIWPFLTTFLLFRVSPRNRLLIIVILILCVSGFRIYSFYHESDLTWSIFAIRPYRATFCRIDSILLGAILAFLGQSNQLTNSARVNSTWLLACLLPFYVPLVGFVSAEGAWLNGGGFLLSNTLCLITVVIALQNPNQIILAHPVLRWIGQRSYGIYVFHMPLVKLLEGLREPGNSINLILVMLLRLILIALVAELSFRFIEKPILRFKSRFEPGQIRSEPSLVTKV